MVLASGDMTDCSVALRNAIKIESLEDPVTPVEAILQRCPKQQMMLQVMKHIKNRDPWRCRTRKLSPASLSLPF